MLSSVFNVTFVTLLLFEHVTFFGRILLLFLSYITVSLSLCVCEFLWSFPEN